VRRTPISRQSTEKIRDSSAGRSVILFSFIFFFQAEDGIRDGHVTGVQTCALPIWRGFLRERRAALRRRARRSRTRGESAQGAPRSEERRVGKECRCRWSPYH